MPRFRIALAQLESRIGTRTYDPRPDNLARARSSVAAAKDLGADLVLFGEMYLTGYHTDEFNARYALDLRAPDPFIGELTRIARMQEITLMMGAATVSAEDSGIVHNSAILVSPTGLSSYDKLHVGHLTLDDGTEVDESLWFSPGSTAPVWETDRFGILGPQICYDCHFPELSRVQALNDAAVFLNITASLTGFEHSWQHLRAARAIENCAWYVTCSIVGTQKGERYFGRSSVVDPTGHVVVEAADGTEDLVVADIDTDEVTARRRHVHFDAARRPQAYDQALCAVSAEVPR